MSVTRVPIDYPKTVVPTIGGFRVVTFVNGTRCVLVGAPRFDTEAEARAFILGAEWALADEGEGEG